MYYVAVEKLCQSVLKYIQKHALIKPGNRVAIAASGGADSVALLRILLELRAELGVVLSVIHFNHKLRGADAEADENFVRELARVYELQFFCESGNVAAYAKKKHFSLEAAARRMRYQYFQRLFDGRAVNRIATAHTLDDQAETVLLKLARGAGTRGLAGIYPELEIRGDHFPPEDPDESSVSPPELDQLSPEPHGPNSVIRPMLANRRKDIETYLRSLKQNWREDKSNRDLRHARNRVRHGILPRMERHLNPAVRESLAETADIARAEERYWADEVSRLLPLLWKVRSQNAKAGTASRTSDGTLASAALANLPLALQRRIVRAAAEYLGLRLEFHHVDDVLATTQLASGQFLALPDGWSIHKGKTGLRFERLPETTEHSNLAVEYKGHKYTEYEYELEVPGRASVPEIGTMFESALVPVASETRETSNLQEPALPVGKLKVRNWHAGDRFWPAHRKDPKKIKALLQEKHVTGLERKLWPVVAVGPEVVWMRGFPAPDRLVTRNEARFSLLIRELPLTG